MHHPEATVLIGHRPPVIAESVVATLLPSRNAARVDPLVAIRAE